MLLRAARAAIPVVLVALGAIILHARLVVFSLGGLKPLILAGMGGDQWLYVYLLRIEFEKLLGQDASGLWNGMFFYPLHEQSLLLTEPQWGVSVALFPIWLLLGDEYVTLGAGAVIALVLGWVSTFAFARHLGASPITAAAAAATLGTSSAFLTLLTRPFFWPFGLMVLLIYLTDRVCQSPGRGWIAAFAAAAGALAWSSCHLAVMALVFATTQAAFCFHARLAPSGAARRLAVAGVAAAALAAVPLLPQHLALSRNGFERSVEAQAGEGANAGSFLLGTWSTTGNLLARSGVALPTGEIVIGLPLFALGVAAIGFALQVARAKPGARRRSGRRTAAAVLFGAVPGILVAVLIPDRVGGFTMDRVAIAAVYVPAGIVVALLGPRIARALRTRAAWFFACAVLFAGLAAGPFFDLGGGRAIPSPALPLCRLPGLAGIRASARWGLPCAFAIGVSAALAIEELRARRIRVVVAAALLAALVADAWAPAHRDVPPAPTAPATWQPRAVDRYLRDARNPGAVLELPISARQQESERMISRLHHRRPLVNGYAGMIPDFFRDHWVDPNADIRATGTLTPANVALLRAFGARYWVVHEDELRPEVRGRAPESFGPIRKIATLDEGRTLVYEDSEAGGG